MRSVSENAILNHARHQRGTHHPHTKALDKTSAQRRDLLSSSQQSSRQSTLIKLDSIKYVCIEFAPIAHAMLFWTLLHEAVAAPFYSRMYLALW